MAGASIPIVWAFLDKSDGNSNPEERITIMEKVLQLIPVSKIDEIKTRHRGIIRCQVALFSISRKLTLQVQY
ncbi:MAG: hypothetical protein KAG53_02630 [Endozoicomonadaceae bacterium]|nr:hypothetical protein [Endozoicomonadaceae bacterium]